MKIVVEFEQSLKKQPPIAPGTADPYEPPKYHNPAKKTQRTMKPASIAKPLFETLWHEWGSLE
jgi:hypothetical protein